MKSTALRLMPDQIGDATTKAKAKETVSLQFILLHQIKLLGDGIITG